MTHEGSPQGSDPEKYERAIDIIDTSSDDQPQQVGQAPDTQPEVAHDVAETDGVLSVKQEQVTEDKTETLIDVIPADDGHDDHEGRWGKQKAETLGAVVNEAAEKRYAYLLKNQMERLDRLRPDELEARARIAEEMLKTYQKRYKGTAENVENFRDVTEEAYDTRRASFEELYDSNTEKFGQMPTSEFIELGRIFGSNALNIEDSVEQQEHLMDFRDRLTTILQEASLSGEQMDRLKKEFDYRITPTAFRALNPHDWPYLELETTRESAAEMEAKRDSINNNFDKSPRQLVEMMVGYVNEINIQLQEHITTTKKAQQAIQGRTEPATEIS